MKRNGGKSCSKTNRRGTLPAARCFSSASSVSLAVVRRREGNAVNHLDVRLLQHSVSRTSVLHLHTQKAFHRRSAYAERNFQMVIVPGPVAGRSTWSSRGPVPQGPADRQAVGTTAPTLWCFKVALKLPTPRGGSASAARDASGRRTAFARSSLWSVHASWPPLPRTDSRSFEAIPRPAYVSSNRPYRLHLPAS